MKNYYIVEGWEEKIFTDEETAGEFLASMTDGFTDDGLLLLCEEKIYELHGENELQEYLLEQGFELEDVEFVD